MKFLAAALLLIHVFLARGQEWDGLRVTFDFNPFNPYRYARLPRTVEAAKDEDWKEMTEGAACDGSYFKGHRYIRFDENLGRDDTATMLLFDVNGYIAGIQAGIREDLQPEYPADDIIPPFHHETENNMYTTTAYFVDPTIICEGGRTEEDFLQQGTGDRLLLQSGDEFIRMPMDQSDADDMEIWTKGGCLPGMGIHYWYNMTPETSCDELWPLFIMYNRGRLNAFGWFFQGDAESRRFEDNTGEGIHRTIATAPDCMKDIDFMSTMHVYTTDNPGQNFC